MTLVDYKTKYLGKTAIALTFLTALSWRLQFAAAMTTAEQQEILNIHNLLRRGEGSSNMNILTWNPTLAIIAQNWSDNCVWEHGQGVNSSSLKALKIGQNLFTMSPAPINLTYGVNAWFGEKVDYVYSSNTCGIGKVCGHYTQVVWADSYEVGCGYTVCPVLRGIDSTNNVYLVCNYNPAGNFVGKLPYLKGPACSKCTSGFFYCNNGLCDRSCNTTEANCTCSAACQNCANVTSDCRCKCGVGWTGVDCSVVCNDTHANCNPPPGVAGWPPSWCVPKYPYVLDACPKMCGLCVGGTPTLCSTSALPKTTPVTTQFATSVQTTALLPITSKATSPSTQTSVPPASSAKIPATTARSPSVQTNATALPTSKATSPSTQTSVPPASSAKIPATTARSPSVQTNATALPTSKATSPPTQTSVPPASSAKIPATTARSPSVQTNATALPTSKATSPSTQTSVPPASSAKIPATTARSPSVQTNATALPTSKATSPSTQTSVPPASSAKIPATTARSPSVQTNATALPTSKATSPSTQTSVPPASSAKIPATTARSPSVQTNATALSTRKATYTSSIVVTTAGVASVSTRIASTRNASWTTESPGIGSTTGLPDHQPPPFGYCLFVIVPGLKIYRRPLLSSRTLARIFDVYDMFMYFGKEKLNADGSWFLFVGAMPDYLPAGWVSATAVALDDSSSSCG